MDAKIKTFFLIPSYPIIKKRSMIILRSKDLSVDLFNQVLQDIHFFCVIRIIRCFPLRIKAFMPDFAFPILKLLVFFGISNKKVSQKATLRSSLLHRNMLFRLCPLKVIIYR